MKIFKYLNDKDIDLVVVVDVQYGYSRIIHNGENEMFLSNVNNSNHSILLNGFTEGYYSFYVECYNDYKYESSELYSFFVNYPNGQEPPQNYTNTENNSNPEENPTYSFNNLNLIGERSMSEKMTMRVGECLLAGGPPFTAAEPEVIIGELDGPFAYIIATPDSVGIVRDKLGLRPLMYGVSDDVVIIASEEGALQTIESLLNIKLKKRYLNRGEVLVWHLKK